MPFRIEISPEHPHFNQQEVIIEEGYAAAVIPDWQDSGYDLVLVAKDNPANGDPMLLIQEFNHGQKLEVNFAQISIFSPPDLPILTGYEIWGVIKIELTNQSNIPSHLK